MTIRAVIGDTDWPIRNMTKKYIGSFKEFEVVGEASDGESLVKICRKVSPDALFLDIDMPGLDCLSAVRRLQREMPSLLVILVSANAHYAAEAFNMDAVDFLVKPFTRERIGKSLNKISRLRKLAAEGSGTAAPEVGCPSNLNRQILVKHGHGILIIEKNSIFFVEKLGRKSIVHTTRGNYEISAPLVTFEEILPRPMFFRCHKGYIINIQMVEKIVPYADRAYEISFYDYSRKVPMRREKFEEFCLMIQCG